MNKKLSRQQNESLSEVEEISRELYISHAQLSSTFGNDWFGEKAETFARFFGTPLFLGAQTIIVILWIIANVSGIVHFDIYPFILLNLAFSIQAAYAAPLILLAQTRQASRDNARVKADSQHRERLAQDSIKRLGLAQQNTERLLELLEQNTQLTILTKELSENIDKLITELHERVLKNHESISEK